VEALSRRLSIVEALSRRLMITGQWMASIESLEFDKSFCRPLKRGSGLV